MASKKAAVEEKKGASVVGAGDVLFYAFGLGLFLYGLELKGALGAFTAVPTTAPQWPFYVTAALIPSSHLLYAYIWFRPKKFKAACKKAPLKWLGKHAVAVFSKFVLGLKLFQQAALLGFVSSYSLDGAKKLLYAQTPTTLGIALFLLAAGQVLNISIYKAIGNDGVYYGFKLGRPVPWSSAFPFNAGFRHPQYVGAIVSQYGVLLPLVAPDTIAAGLPLLTVWWTSLYVLTSVQEASGDNDK